MNNHSTNDAPATGAVPGTSRNVEGARATGPIIVIGAGNPMRGDDGFGWEVAERLADLFAMDRDVRVVSSFQVLPEFAEMVSVAPFVLFIDAQVGVEPGCLRCQSIHDPAVGQATPGVAPGIGSHHTTPQAILESARQLYGHAPPTALLTVGAASMAYGASFSPKVARLIDPAVHIAQLLVKHFQDDPGRSVLMHEFAVVEGIVNRALAELEDRWNDSTAAQPGAASNANGRDLPPALGIRVTVQRSSEFSEEALYTAFEALTQGTSLEGADLDIETVEHEFTCRCGYQQVIRPDDLIGHMYVCPACGAIHEIAEAHGVALVGVEVLAPDGQPDSKT